MKNVFYFSYLLTMLVIVVFAEIVNLIFTHTIGKKPIRRFEL